MTVAPVPSLSPIATERLRLRPLGAPDAAAFHAMTDEPGILDAVHFLADPFDVGDAEGLIVGHGDGRDCFWGVWRHGDPALVGTVGTHLRGDAEIEVGYWFASAVRGRGLAFEAVGAVVSALAKAYPDRRVTAECRPGNEPSWCLLERVGFRVDGTEGARPGRRRFVLPRSPSGSPVPDAMTRGRSPRGVA